MRFIVDTGHDIGVKDFVDVSFRFADATFHMCEGAQELMIKPLVMCRDCDKHNKGAAETDNPNDRCPLIIHRGYAKGHEFDYQYCSYGRLKNG